MKIILQSTTNFPPLLQLNSSNFSISSLSSPLSHRKLKLFPKNTRLAVSTRYSRKSPRNLKIDEQSVGYYSQTSSAYISHIELICPDEKISKASSDVKRSLNTIAKMDEERISRLCDLDPTPIFELSVHSGLKFALLFGLISFHGSGQALASGMQSLASSDFAGGIQPFTGDLGDISTGFAGGIQPFTGDLGDISTGFASAFLLIFFSELGDKTFFIAALLAARNSWAIIFIGTFGALAAMTIISVLLGRTFHYIDDILPFRFGDTDLPIDDIAAVCLLVYFGVSSLLEASSSDGLKVEEEQKEAELAVSEFSGNGAGIVAAASSVISTFLLVFVAEWGDKSFFSTIALAAAGSPLGVIGGALAGHAAATLLAVLGGSLLGTFLSEKAIAYVGGSLFLIFAAVTLIEIVS